MSSNHEIANINLVYVAISTSLAYDIIFSFVDEVKYIWNGMRWSIPKVLYIITRYYSFIYLLIETILPIYFSPGMRYASLAMYSQFLKYRFVTLTVSILNRCRATVVFHLCGGLIIIGTALDLIFMFRVSALYGNSKKIVLFLAFWFSIQFLGTLAVTLFNSISESEYAIPFKGICMESDSASTSLYNILPSVCFAVSLALHTTLFLLTIVKAGVGFIRDHGGIWKVLQNGRSTFNPLLYSLISDGTLYFCIVFVSTVVMNLGAVDPKLNACFIYFSPFYIAILSCSGSRLILQLRRVSNFTESGSSPTFSQSIFFAREANLSLRFESDNE
ncbi:hypothetical protein BDQ17DRAFT_1384029 [Cyathus striatus]|nr:hypothetical protein BDQ17DRAFT_1384029 [Cyathus striatus]